MLKRIKFIAWMAGLFILIRLISYPITETIESIEPLRIPLSNKIIVLDPGHGGVDGGAVGDGKVLEKDIALNVSKRLRDYLQQAGAEVHLTRETDRDLAHDETKSISQRKVEDIKNRVVFMKEIDPDIFISIHLNSLPTPKWRGAQTFYHPNNPESKILADKIQDQIIFGLENTNRVALAINSVYILKHASRPAALVEIGFLSNPDERELLIQSPYQDKMAASIYFGILNYFSDEARQ